MDERTLDIYRHQTDEYFQRYLQSSPVIRPVLRFLRKGFSLLDYGAGSGRDADALLDAGYDVYAYDPVEEFSRKAVEHYPRLSGRYFSHPEDIRRLAGQMDGVLANGVFQHIPDAELGNIIREIQSISRKESFIFISIPVEYPDIREGRDAAGRLFRLRPEDEYIGHFSSYGYVLREREEAADSLRRNGVRWVFLVLERSGL